MFGLGATELIIIFVIALIVFGPKKLPELGKALGKGIAQFKRASDEVKESIESEVRTAENTLELDKIKADIEGKEKELKKQEAPADKEGTDTPARATAPKEKAEDGYGKS